MKFKKCVQKAEFSLERQEWEERIYQITPFFWVGWEWLEYEEISLQESYSP